MCLPLHQTSMLNHLELMDSYIWHKYPQHCQGLQWWRLWCLNKQANLKPFMWEENSAPMIHPYCVLSFQITPISTRAIITNLTCTLYLTPSPLHSLCLPSNHIMPILPALCWLYICINFIISIPHSTTSTHPMWRQSKNCHFSLWTPEVIHPSHSCPMQTINALSQ